MAQHQMTMPCMCLIVVLLILTLSATCVSNIEKFEPYFPDSLVQYITGDDKKPSDSGPGAMNSFKPYGGDNNGKLIGGIPNSSNRARPNSSRPSGGMGGGRPNSSGMGGGMGGGRPNSSGMGGGMGGDAYKVQPSEEFLSSNLLPKNNSAIADDAFVLAPKDLQNMNFLDATTRIGVDTVSSSLRNANYGLRSEPTNPKTEVSPWMNSDIDPDLARRPLET